MSAITIHGGLLFGFGTLSAHTSTASMLSAGIGHMVEFDVGGGPSTQPNAAAVAKRVTRARHVPKIALSTAEKATLSTSQTGIGTPTASNATNMAIAPSANAASANTSQAGGSGSGLSGSLGAEGLARPPRLAGSAQWDCPFPREADDVNVHEATATLRVEVGVAGNVQSVAVVRDPGDGFGREARQCAFRKQWLPGYNNAGNVVAAAVVVNVRFRR